MALREAGAGDAFQALATRAASQASLDEPNVFWGTDDREAVAGLMHELLTADANDAVQTLGARAANAGMFHYVGVYPDRASRYPFGREPDGAPSPSWNWQGPAGQNRAL
jgi:hypothetical protein